jgi:hypothetical protein
MKFAREIAGLSITAVVLSQCGCSASGFRNLFAKNQRSEFHTLEELDAKKDAASAESAAAAKSAEAKAASWSPFKRDSETTTPATAPDSKTASRETGFWKNPFGGNPDKVTDPFLPAGKEAAATTDEVRTAAMEEDEEESGDTDARDNRIARASAVRDDADEDEAPKITARPRKSSATDARRGAEELEVAEPLILKSGERSVADRRAELERQKIVQLEELLASGDFRRKARTARETVTKAGTDAEARVQRSREAIVDSSAAAAKQARTEASERVAQIDDFFEELEEQGSLAADQVTETAFELAEADESQDEQSESESSTRVKRSVTPPNGAGTPGRSDRAASAVSATKRADTQINLFEDALASSTPAEADPEADQPAVRKSAVEDAAENSDFQWQASRPAVKASSGRGAAKNIRQVALTDESATTENTGGKDQWLEDEVFAPTAALKAPNPGKAAAKVRNVSGTTGNRGQQSVADPFVSGELEQPGADNPAAVPTPGARPEPDERRGSAIPEVSLPDADTAAAPKTPQATAPAAGLSTRSWVAIAAGLAVVGLLFLPSRRRTGTPVTASAQS